MGFIEVVQSGKKTEVHNNGVCSVTLYFRPEIRDTVAHFLGSTTNTGHPYAIVFVHAIERSQWIDRKVIYDYEQIKTNRWWLAIKAKLGFVPAADELRDTVIGFIKIAEEYKLGHDFDKQSFDEVIKEAKQVSVALAKMSQLIS